jgi:hypothetical protein
MHSGSLGFPTSPFLILEEEWETSVAGNGIEPAPLDGGSSRMGWSWFKSRSRYSIGSGKRE